VLVDKKNKKKFRSLAIIFSAMVVVCSSGITLITNPAVYAADEPAKPAASAPANKTTGELLTIHIDQLEAYYQDVMTDYASKGYKDATTQVTIPATTFVSQSDKLATVGNYAGKNNVLIWKSDRTNTIDYTVNVPQDGLYQMEMTYRPYKDDPNSDQLARRAVQLSVQYDGTYQFREARAVPFRGLFKDLLPLKKDINGDNIRPKPLQINEWITSAFEDIAGSYNEPLKWYLTKGTHKLTLSAFDPIVIESIKLVGAKPIGSYEQVSSKYGNAQTKSTDIITLQGEEPTAKNDVAIQIETDQDPMMEPQAGGNDIFNSIGGTRWQTGGQRLDWKFTVPEDGKYKIALRYKQSFLSNLASFRTLKIDGVVPFSEMLAYKFPFATGWKGKPLTNDAGIPYEYYLTKGEHTLSLTSTTGPFQPVMVKSDQVNTELQIVSQELQAMTGGVVDKNRTWKINDDFPELPQQLTEVRDKLKAMADEMLSVNGKRDNTLQTMNSAINDIEGYLSYPDEIPYHIDDIATLETSIASIRETLAKAPLQIDQIYIAPSSVPLPKMEANLFEKMGGMVHNFFYSFIKKDDISNLDPNALNVWVNRGRDYVNELQELADEMFTPETGIKVKVNLLPNENLLILANAAGLAPDVALGQPQDKSIDFAQRNALYDLTQFPDFQEVASQFAPGAMLPFFYNGGYYALPEAQNFKVLFYRKDILSNLGLGIPDTWEDVYDMMPTLQQNGYNFYVPHGDYVNFIYQNGADFFTKDGMKTGLDSPEAFKGFKMFTDLFNIYAVDPQVATFYQHLRKGDMPIGIGDYNQYLLMSAAAPELNGWWGIAPLPGIKQPNGEVARWASGGQQTAFMYKSSTKKEQAWKFIKWWISADTQERYGNDLESFNGITFRWNTANIDALVRLPWPKADLQVILQQWKWYREVPNLPGSYYVGREMNNAWNRTVVDGMNYRESLEQAIVNINREMLRKEQEFGFVSKDGKVLHTLDLPQITKPWEGVDKYVRK
jgi:ABC-type glycerol-3-phosphate transport system substrate-binding protein